MHSSICVYPQRAMTNKIQINISTAWVLMFHCVGFCDNLTALNIYWFIRPFLHYYNVKFIKLIPIVRYQSGAFLKLDTLSLSIFNYFTVSQQMKLIFIRTSYVCFNFVKLTPGWFSSNPKLYVDLYALSSVTVQWNKN